MKDWKDLEIEDIFIYKFNKKGMFLSRVVDIGEDTILHIQDMKKFPE